MEQRSIGNAGPALFSIGSANDEHAHCSIGSLLIASATGLGATAALAQTYAEQERRSGDERGVELTRGPVHETFVGTVKFDPEQGTDVGRAPPDPLEERPPDRRPEGASVAWIPGYGARDGEQDDPSGAVACGAPCRRAASGQSIRPRASLAKRMSPCTCRPDTRSAE